MLNFQGTKEMETWEVAGCDLMSAKFWLILYLWLIFILIVWDQEDSREVQVVWLSFCTDSVSSSPWVGHEVAKHWMLLRDSCTTFNESEIQLTIAYSEAWQGLFSVLVVLWCVLIRQEKYHTNVCVIVLSWSSKSKYREISQNLPKKLHNKLRTCENYETDKKSSSKIVFLFCFCFLLFSSLFGSWLCALHVHVNLHDENISELSLRLSGFST